ncbi:MAG: hypothetical protein GTN78_22500 [Gemmatimonadales bacterium]|nr:hypothetical protein [Gemmatimonadales bacterium]NIR02938.1 hypothetical protein [Gemmatimonadales bacterium]
MASQREITLGVVGDVHGRVDRLRTVVEWLRGTDLSAVLAVGDLDGGWPEPREGKIPANVLIAIDLLRSLDVPAFFVPGNHDHRSIPLEGNLDGRAEQLGPLVLAGIGGSGPALHGLPYEWTDEELRGRIVFRDCHVLLCHAPPARTPLDRFAGSDVHLGSETIREIAERMTGLLVCGHIHEGVGTVLLNRCFCYNAGSLADPFGRTQVGVVSWDLGTGRLAVEHHDLDGGGSWSSECPVPLVRRLEER